MYRRAASNEGRKAPDRLTMLTHYLLRGGSSILFISKYYERLNGIEPISPLWKEAFLQVEAIAACEVISILFLCSFL